MSITFGDFAKTLQPYFRRNRNISDYVTELVDNIIDDISLTPATGLGNDTLEKWFNGNLPKERAFEILANLNREKFIEYISKPPYGTQDELAKDLYKRYNRKFREEYFAEFCADLFVEILRDCAEINSR